MVTQKIQASQYKKRQEKLSEILYDDQTMFLITPLQVLIISLIFIANVFLLHLVSRFVPSTSAPQIAISLIVVVLSIFITVLINKK